MQLPKIISVDHDHVIEPQTLWTERLPAKYRQSAPHGERTCAAALGWTSRGWAYAEDADHPDSKWTDVWV